MIVTETERFILKTWHPNDAAGAFEFYGDPLVSKLIGNGEPVKDIEQVERTLRIFIDHQNKHRFSPWAIVEKSSGNIVGICGLHKFNQQKENELGFRIKRSEWGKGIASEVGRESIRHGVEELGLKNIISLTHLENFATQRVLEKIGFTKVRKQTLKEISQTVFRYELML